VRARQLSSEVIEAIHFQSGSPSYTPDTSHRHDIEKQKHRILPGQISTHLRYGSSIKTKGTVDPRQVSQPIDVTRGKQGELVARNTPGVEQPQVTFHAIYAFKRPNDIPVEYLDAVKKADFEGAQQMVEDAATYLAEAFAYTTLDAVMPVLSSKPLANSLAEAIAEKLELPIWRGDWIKQRTVKDVRVGSRWNTELFKFKSDPMQVPNRILLVDDFITSRQTLVELAKKLYNAGATYVVGAALVGRA